jgi:hypothetical protein
VLIALYENDTPFTPNMVDLGRTITFKIIAPDMSAPQNPVRLVDERWFANRPGALKPNGA